VVDDCDVHGFQDRFLPSRVPWWCRLLGSLADAEDVVQEAYARWYAMPPQDQEAIESPGGWLTTVASRICLDLAQQEGVTVGVLAFDVAGDRIKHIWAVRNPEKLRPWTR
jgi:DNA-directed RNA polymerase specialized sigma24 family protein